MAGLKPSEIKDIHLWEFNQYIKAYQEKIREREKSIIKIAYYGAYFNNSKKSKSLKYYMKEIDKSTTQVTKRDNDKLKFAKEMYNKINNIST